MNDNAWDSLLAAHLDAFPHAEPADLYKLLYQAILGVEHALGPELLLRDKLIEEVRGLDLTPREWEEPAEPIHPTRDLARVHLRPYLRAGGSLDRLATAMLQTAAQWPPTPTEQLAATLGLARAALRRVAPTFDHAGFDKLLHEMALKAFPAQHHSDAFKGTYDPHYRVVLLDLLAPPDEA